MTEPRRGWTREQYHVWHWFWGLLGVFMTFVFFGTNYWLFGLFSLGCLGFAAWCWIELHRK